MPHPTPLVRARPATEEELPRTARTLLAAGADAGWDGWATYAHGTSMDARGEPTRLTESLVVRMVRRESPATQVVVATWHDGKFRTGWAWRTDTMAVQVGSRALVALVRESP